MHRAILELKSVQNENASGSDFLAVRFSFTKGLFIWRADSDCSGMLLVSANAPSEEIVLNSN